MTIRNIARYAVLLAGLASVAFAVGACHSRASDFAYRSTHSRHR